MKILDNLTVDGHIRINNPYDLYADSIMGTNNLHLSAQQFSGPTLILENALDLSNDEITRQWEGAGVVQFRRRFGDSIPLDKDRAGTVNFLGWSGARNANVLRPNPDPRDGTIYFSDWNSCAAIHAEFVGTPSLVTTGSPKGPKMPGELVFSTTPEIAGASPAERMRINKDGYVGIGISTPQERVHINGNLQFQSNNRIFGKNSAGTSEVCLIPRRSDNYTLLRYGTAGFVIENNKGDNCMSFQNDRDVFINTNLSIGGSTGNPGSPFSLYARGAIRTNSYVFAGVSVEAPILSIGPFTVNSNPDLRKGGGGDLVLTTYTDGDYIFRTRSGNQTRMVIRADGKIGINTINPNALLEVNGALAKKSSTFLIDHPLDPLNKDLFHGMVEAPRYDLIYRGIVQLSNGEAIVDIDLASNMTKGTFNALTQNAEVVGLVNKTSFSRLKASTVVNGEFTITCEDNFSGDTVSWVVMAERHDPFIINNPTTRTDENGHLIPEHNKPEL